MLAAKSPQMRKAVGVLKELSADEATRMRYENREMALRDFESMKDDALRENDEKWRGVVADNIAALADKDAALVSQAALIAELQAQLGKSM